MKETEDLHNLLYTLHIRPVIDSIRIASIVKATKEDPVLTELTTIIWKRQNWIPKNSPDKFKKCKPILDEITITGNDILMKSDTLKISHIYYDSVTGLRRNRGSFILNMKEYLLSDRCDKSCSI